MKITRVTATPLNVPAQVARSGRSREVSLSMCLVDVETDTGLVGTGMTAITEEEVIQTIVEQVAAPALLGADPMRHEQLWERLHWLLAPRGQSGYAFHAMAAIDLALWDLKGQALGEPCWRLLGGARERVPLYATFGFAFLDRDELAASAQDWVSRGFTRLKMTVGHHGLQRRDEPRPMQALIAEDACRMRAVRDAVGPEVMLFIDANCSLDAWHATRVARAAQDVGVALFEEPVAGNDVQQLRRLRDTVPIPLAAGQNEGLASRFRDLLAAEAVDVIQPNACISGGFTQCQRIAGLAQAYGATFANGGAWSHHNMHLHGGLANGTLVEYHAVAVECCAAVFDDLAQPDRGELPLPTAPGLGFRPNRDRVADLARRPLSRGAGKA